MTKSIGQSINPEMPSGAMNNVPNNSVINSNIQNQSKNNSTAPTEVGAKKSGVVRLGLANVKTGTVGEASRHRNCRARCKIL